VARRADPRDAVAALVASLASDLDDVAAWVRLRDHVSVVRSTEHSQLDRSFTALLRVRARHGRRHLEAATDDLDAKSLAALSAALRASAGGGSARTATARTREARHWERTSSIPVAESRDRDLRDRCGELFAELAALPSSRLIRRAVRIDRSEEQTFYIGKDRPLEARIVRDRAQASLVAWTGSDVQSAVLAAGASGATMAELRADELAQLEEWALTMVTARRVEPGVKAVLLSPRLAAAFIGGCLAPALDASLDRDVALRGRALASSLVSVVDDPVGSGYGARFFDDDGVLAREAHLMREGLVVSTLGADGPARGRRHRDDRGTWLGAPTNLELLPGSAAEATLIADIDDGMVVDGPIAARVDPISLDFSLEASRGLGVRRGILDGRVFGRVTLHGRLDRVLAAARGLSTHSERVPLMMAFGDGVPIEVRAPSILSEALVVPG